MKRRQGGQLQRGPFRIILAAMTELGILGGTFDPPHLGHLTLARLALEQFSLESVLWVLTPSPPHKQGQSLTPLEHRLAMLTLALEGEKAFSLSRVDIDRPAPHYAVDTVRLLSQAYPQTGLIYLMGGDSLADLPRWHRAADFLAACHALIVWRRLEDGVNIETLEARLPGLSAKVRFLQAPYLPISSTEIRQKLAHGEEIQNFLPPAVYAYILQHQLYRPETQTLNL